jgi:hypothetical protein
MTSPIDDLDFGMIAVTSLAPLATERPLALADPALRGYRPLSALCETIAIIAYGFEPLKPQSSLGADAERTR